MWLGGPNDPRGLGDPLSLWGQVVCADHGAFVGRGARAAAAVRRGKTVAVRGAVGALGGHVLRIVSQTCNMPDGSVARNVFVFGCCQTHHTQNFTRKCTQYWVRGINL